MAQQKLRVRARGTYMVCDLEALSAGSRRYIGRKYDASLGFPVVDDKGKPTGQLTGGWPSTGEVHEVPARFEYIDEVQRGCLWAADPETATLCGVTFDPACDDDGPQASDDDEPAQ